MLTVVNSSDLVKIGNTLDSCFPTLWFFFFLSGENAMGRGLKHVECMITLSSVEYLSPMLMTDL